MSAAPGSLILLVACPDQKGLVAAVTGFLSRRAANILDLEQHTDAGAGWFFMRLEFDPRGLTVSEREFRRAFAPLAARLAMTWSLHRSDHRARLAVFVTREPHCLYDLLARCESGEWPADIRLVVGNRPDLRAVARRFGVPFRVVPITPETKAAQERRELALLRAHRIDTVILARYMQILSPAFVRRLPHRIINIHHSFLPSFMGAKPYHAAHARGVKIIGATSHYVTGELDQGPIIEQDVIRVSHRDSAEDFVRRGRDVETVVLARAVAAHLEHRVIVHQNRTVVFH